MPRGSRPSAHVRRWSFDRSWVGAGVEPATDALRARCSTTELANNGGEAGSRTQALAGQPMHHRSVASGKAACAAVTGRARPPHTGGVHEPLACERLPFTTDSSSHTVGKTHWRD